MVSKNRGTYGGLCSSWPNPFRAPKPLPVLNSRKFGSRKRFSSCKGVNITLVMILCIRADVSYIVCWSSLDFLLLYGLFMIGRR